MALVSIPIANRSERRATDRYLPLLAVGFAGYATFGKSFAYLGAPPFFVGEMLLCLGVLALFASGCFVSFIATGPALCAVLLLGWVTLRTIQGIGIYGVDALRDGAVGIYAVFAFIVAALLIERPARLAHVVAYFRVQVRVLVPVAIGLYFIARFAYSSLPRIPGQDVEILAIRSGELATHICGATVFILVGLCKAWPGWSAIVLVGSAMVATQNRGGMLALILPILFALVVTGQVRRLATIGMVISLTMGLAYAADLSIEIPRGERPISARALVDNLFSIAGANDSNNLDGTKQWRLNWWEEIRRYTFDGPYFWSGKGFGVNLAEADGFVVGLERGGPVLRSPHSVHMTYLARSGVPGLVLWILCVATWIVALLRTSRQAYLRGERDWSNFFIFLVCYLTSIVIDASFDVALEGPMLGIPFWILFGVGLGAIMIYRGLHVVVFRAPVRAAAEVNRTAVFGFMAFLVCTCLSSPPAEAANTPKSSDMSSEKSSDMICPAGAVNIGAGLPIQVYVDRSLPSTTFCIQPGLYRMQQISPKHRQVFIGLPGAVLNGAEIIANIKPEGGYWVAATPLVSSRPFGSCLKSRPWCNNPIRFFLDDRPLEPVGSLEDLRSGAVFHNLQTRKVYLFDNPRGRTLEMAHRRYAFFSNGARDVVVRGFIVEKYATPAQLGAIFGDEDRHATGWIIEGNEVRLNSGAGIATGDNTIVRGNRVHHNGQLGISPNGVGVVIEDNEIYENNIYGFDAAWEGGGVKAGAVENLTLRRNRVHDNYGSGLWCDVDCRNMLVEENIVDRNADAGIFYELSHGAIIRNNIARWNGTGAGGQQGGAWFWGAGIQIAASRNVEVYGNMVTAAQGGTGIILIDQARKRPGPSGGLYQTVENIVQNNQIIYEGKGGVSGGASDVPADNPNYGIIENGRNRFDGNIYTLQQTTEPAKFIWGGDPISIEAFRNLGQEMTGRIIH